MANLWHNNNGEGWLNTEIQRAAILAETAIVNLSHAQLKPGCGEVILYSCRRSSNSPTAPWVIVAPRGAQLRINNVPLTTGIRVLANRDAIRLGDSPSMFFSTEHLAHIEGFPLADSVFCGRCKLEIQTHDLAVCCPLCGIWHHEQADHERLCWSYSETCTVCDQPTAASATYRWTPEAL